MAPPVDRCHLLSFTQIGATDQKIGGSNPSERARVQLTVTVTGYTKALQSGALNPQNYWMRGTFFVSVIRTR